MVAVRSGTVDLGAFGGNHAVVRYSGEDDDEAAACSGEPEEPDPEKRQLLEAINLHKSTLR